MKKILGLDLGVSSIGWALVNEAENDGEQSSIIRLGVRVNPLTVDEQSDFEQGKTVTTNAKRTAGRSARRNLQRFKLRRHKLVDCLRENGIISENTLLYEDGKGSTYQTYQSRVDAVTRKVSLDEFARVLLMINRKRGYKSSRKANNNDEGKLIDGMDVAKRLYEEGITPGQLVLSFLEGGRNYIPDFYRSDLQTELDRIWDKQKEYYPDVLTEALKNSIAGRSRKETSSVMYKAIGMPVAENKGKDRRLQAFKWRVEALEKQLPLDIIAAVVCDINGNIYAASGYLNDISERSKELYFSGKTVGQYLFEELEKDHNFSQRNKVFYRQDYIDEFNRIWDRQAEYYSVLTPALKKRIRDEIIFYQRPLKSQKGLVSYCEFESHEIIVNVEGKMKKRMTGSKVCPKSSPLFQVFRIWQVLNNMRVTSKITGEVRFLTLEEKKQLFGELNIRKSMKGTDILKLLFRDYREHELNYESVEGNETMALLYDAFSRIISMAGQGEYDFGKMSSVKINDVVRAAFGAMGLNTDILEFDPLADNDSFERQPMYRLWHLLYSYEGDNSDTGNQSLIDAIADLCGMDRNYAREIASISFKQDYGSLSAKAMRKILPHMMQGIEYSQACLAAGFNHSKSSLTKEQIENRQYLEHLEPIRHNSLRNPVVEKILNQMVNVVNAVVDTYGKPDEVRIELARELKSSTSERESMYKAMQSAKQENKRYSEILQKEFHIPNPSRNDIIKYRLYLELKDNGFHTLYSNTYIERDRLFTKDFDVEHIIPQAMQFDDSFSNKTLESRQINIDKGNMTALDFVSGRYGEEGAATYRARVEELRSKGIISYAKYRNLLKTEADIEEGFINRDLRDTQYISRKAREILSGLVKTVVTTTGAITDKLRQDWQLVDVMRELNWDKYERLGMTEVDTNREGNKVYRIKDWTKRNDHRHHAMDALTIAFTKPSFIQLLNNVKAKSDKSSSIYGILRKETYRDKNGKRLFCPPIPLDVFRAEAKRHLESLLISTKSKNKVLTKHTNRIRTKHGVRSMVQLTPRGQLHKETVYGTRKQYVTSMDRVGASFDAAKIATVASKKYREALLARLAMYDGDPKKAFTGKNSLEKNPIYQDELHTDKVPAAVKTVRMETMYTISKDVSPDLSIDKVVDVGIRKLLEKRKDRFNGNQKEAFANLDKDPIYQNSDKGIVVKRVTIKGVNNALPLHRRRNRKGECISPDGSCCNDVDYVSTGNNHHVAIFRDADGELHEQVVSFYEAVKRASQGRPVIDRNYNKDKGWTLLFTMKQNEYFVFPNEETGFDPAKIDLMDPANYPLISPNLFRVQKLATKNYTFRHHLETTVDETKELKGVTWNRFQSFKGLDKIVKVRVNHLGQIVATGEY